MWIMALRKGEYSAWQSLILRYTTILLWHIYLFISSSSSRQYTLSAGVVSLILTNNIGILYIYYI